MKTLTQWLDRCPPGTYRAVQIERKFPRLSDTTSSTKWWRAHAVVERHEMVVRYASGESMPTYEDALASLDAALFEEALAITVDPPQREDPIRYDPHTGKAVEP